MRNVKAILIGVALCATVFANARIEALGGDAGFWPGDRANADAFPQTLNNGQWLEFGNVNGEGGPTGSINWNSKDANWGFNFDAAGNADFIHMSWAKNGMGLRVGVQQQGVSMLDLNFDTDGNCLLDDVLDENGNVSYEGCDYTTWDHDNDPTTAEIDTEYSENLSRDVSGFSVAWGQDFSFGEVGISITTTDDIYDNVETWDDDDDPATANVANPDYNPNGTATDEMEIALNWRGDCNFWVFDKSKAMFWKGDDNMTLSYDLFTHVTPTEGVTALVGMGFEYKTTNEGDGTQLWLPNATLAVEADLADWATFRGFVEQNHWISADTGTTDATTGESTGDLGSGNYTDWGFGLGFGWTTQNANSISLDMEISNSVFSDPVSEMLGFNGDGNLANGAVTLSYEF